MTPSIEHARAAWPDFAVDARGFAEFVAARLAPGEEATALQLGDLYLAYACLDGNARALAALERHHLAPVASYIARIDRSPAFVDEVRQSLRTRLLVGDDGAPPRLTGYSGRGSLAAWMRVCAVRTALNLRRTRLVDGDGAGDAPIAALDPELRLLHARVGGHFRDAFAGALAALELDDRQLLRLHFLEGLSFTRLGRLYGLERSTVARRVAAARERLHDATAARLADRVGLAGDDLASVMRLLRSSLGDVSLTRLLKIR